ncbi:hypothetical protein PCANC_05010 [Puccinia coronata f. sp. avenae]|uniref:Uncharacterized protein n=1 Tax=Puccinia coronata f. sp. avenae TaxID=200324 RepID=A0A2N5T7Q1_9BASI|nr:hypothetical protein PCANC_05010 [Puccinia coronata f. sp. avenae]
MASTHHQTELRTVRKSTLPINTKSPIPSFYEHLNGRWVLSDNWNLYGLSGSNTRHRARSLDEAPSSTLAESNSTLIHHASSAVNGPPSTLQYDASPSTNSSSSSSSTNNNNNNNNQKLYLPAGWNHTSKRGPLYATSVIIVASLLIAIAVLSTVLFLVLRRRARGRRRALLKEGILSSSDHHASHPKLSPREVEEGRGIVIAGRQHRIKYHIKQKFKRLTLVKINRSSRGKPLARVNRISVLSTQPGQQQPPPPSLVVVGEARRSRSFASYSSFRCTGESDGLSRRRTRSHRTESQSDESPASEQLHNPHQTITVNGLLSVPSLRRPSNATTFTPAPLFPATPIPDLDSSIAGPSEIIAIPMESDREYGGCGLSNSHSTSSRSQYPHSAPTSRSHPADDDSADRPVFSMETQEEVCGRRRTRHQEGSRASVDPNYRSCREIIRARSSTSYSYRPPARPIGEHSLMSSSPASLPDLNFTLPPLAPHESFHAQNLPDPMDRRGSRSIEPESISRSTYVTAAPPHSPSQSSFGSIPVGDPLPPAYSGRATPGAGESSRAFEKQRMVDPLDDEEGAHHRAESLADHHRRRQTFSHHEEHHHHQEDGTGPFVAHVATDDKLVLRSLLRMGSQPGEGPRTMGEKEEILLGDGDEDEALRRRTGVGTGGAARMGVTGGGVMVDASSTVAPSAPPLVAEGEDEEGGDEDGYERKGGEPSRQSGVGVLDDSQVGGSARGLAILPAPPAQFIIRFDPSTALVEHHPPPEPEPAHLPPHMHVIASAPPLPLRLSESDDQSASPPSSPSSHLPAAPSVSHPAPSRRLNHRDNLSLTVSIAPPYAE